MVEQIAGFLEWFLLDGPDKGVLGRFRSFLLSFLIGTFFCVMPLVYFVKLPEMNSISAVVWGFLLVLVWCMAGVCFYAFKKASQRSPNDD